MDESHGVRHQPTRRRFLRGIGVTAGALALAPAIAACRGSATRRNSGDAGDSVGAARPVGGGTLTSAMSSDPSGLDYAFNGDPYSKVIIANCAAEYSMGRIRSNKASGPYSQLVAIDTIEKPDQSTVRLALNSPYAPLLYNLADNAGRVISPAIGEEYGNDRLKADLTGQGTGPFKFVEWKAATM